MTENTTPRAGYEYAPGARPLNTPVQESAHVDAYDVAVYDMKAARRWVNECYEGAASCYTWTDQAVLGFVEEQHVDGLAPFRTLTAQQEAAADLFGPTVLGGQYRTYQTYLAASEDAQGAVDMVFREAVQAGGESLTVSIDQDGAVEAGWANGDDQYRVTILPRGHLHRLRKMTQNGDWVTVSRFSQDPAGNMFKRSRAAAFYHHQTGKWMEAVTR